MPETYYRAKVKLRVPNGPGVLPSSVLVQPGEVVVLDGTEPLDVPMMIATGAIVKLDGPPPPEKVNIMPTRKRRAK